MRPLSDPLFRQYLEHNACSFTFLRPPLLHTTLPYKTRGAAICQDGSEAKRLSASVKKCHLPDCQAGSHPRYRHLPRRVTSQVSASVKKNLLPHISIRQEGSPPRLQHLPRRVGCQTSASAMQDGSTPMLQYMPRRVGCKDISICQEGSPPRLQHLPRRITFQT
jgi:hypothetical protein